MASKILGKLSRIEWIAVLVAILLFIAPALKRVLEGQTTLGVRQSIGGLGDLAATELDLSPGFVASLNEDGSQNSTLGDTDLPTPEKIAAKRGSVLQLFGSAVGLYMDKEDQVAASDFTAPDSPLYRTTSLPEVSIGGVRAEVQFSGLAPGRKGVWQINVLVPKEAPSGTVPVTISYEGDAVRSLSVNVE